jgi:hypothetical protein
MFRQFNRDDAFSLAMLKQRLGKEFNALRRGAFDIPMSVLRRDQ